MALILLIDDDDELRTMLRIALESAGHHVQEACNGKIGLEYFSKRAADLVITDLVMPEKEGIEVMMEIRKRTPPPKVIAISGGGKVSAATYLAPATYLGATRVLEKPFSSDKLIQMVNEVLLSK